MRTHPRDVLRGIAKVLAVVLLAVAGGLGLGAALAELTDDGEPTVPPQISVLSTVLTPATAASGRARRRARLTVRVRITNRSARAISLKDAVLLVGQEEVRPDRKAAKVSQAARALLRPISAGERTTGELRFEPSGRVTLTLRRELGARVRLEGRTRSLRFALGKPAPPEG